ncbi:MAG: hypothetical protein QM811_06680 [Pirellulales bacterium]
MITIRRAVEEIDTREVGFISEKIFTRNVVLVTLAEWNWGVWRNGVNRRLAPATRSKEKTVASRVLVTLVTLVSIVSIVTLAQ